MAFTDFTALTTTTLQMYQKSLEDNIFNEMPLLFHLKDKKRKSVDEGGTTIVVPLMYAANDTAGSYAGYDALSVDPQEGMKPAEYNRKLISVSITISGEEELANSNRSQVINLLNAKTKQAEMSIKEQMTTMLYGTGLGNDQKDLLGLAAIVADAPTSGVLAGIDRATFSFWRNKQDTATKTTAAFDNLLKKMRRMYNSCSNGNDHPDFMVCDEATFSGYEDKVGDNQRFTTNKMGDAGFTVLKFKGATLVFDAACPGDGDATTGRMYFLNSKYLWLKVNPKRDFKVTPLLRPTNQDARTGQILWAGAFCSSNCRRLGVLTAID
jgi:hypothetical protein